MPRDIEFKNMYCVCNSNITCALFFHLELELNYKSCIQKNNLNSDINGSGMFLKRNMFHLLEQYYDTARKCTETEDIGDI